MRINCPCCGERAVDEFVCYGEAPGARPDMASPTAMADYVTYVFERTNPAGPNRELWYHASGCHLWLLVTRNVLNHEIIRVEEARKVAAQRHAGAKGGA